MRLSQLDPEKIVQCRFLCAVFQIGITEVISWSKVNDERLSNPYIFECFARGLRALPYLLAVDLTASKQTQVSASKPEKHVAKLAKPSSKKAAKQSDVQRSRSGPPQLRGNKLEQAPFSKWGIFAKVKTQERMRTVRNNIVYHAADNTVQGDPVGAETRCVDSKGQLWSPIFPDLEYLVSH